MQYVSFYHKNVSMIIKAIVREKDGRRRFVKINGKEGSLATDAKTTKYGHKESHTYVILITL